MCFDLTKCLIFFLIQSYVEIKTSYALEEEEESYYAIMYAIMIELITSDIFLNAKWH